MSARFLKACYAVAYMTAAARASSRLRRACGLSVLHRRRCLLGLGERNGERASPALPIVGGGEARSSTLHGCCCRCGDILPRGRCPDASASASASSSFSHVMPRSCRIFCVTLKWGTLRLKRKLLYMRAATSAAGSVRGGSGGATEWCCGKGSAGKRSVERTRCVHALRFAHPPQAEVRTRVPCFV